MNPTDVGGGAAAPTFQDAMQLSELVVPLVPDGFYHKGAAIAAGLCERWGTDLKLVHVAADDDELEAAARRVAEAHPSVSVTATHLEGPSVPQAVAELARPERLLVVETTHASDAGAVPSIADDLLRSYPGPVLLLGPATDSEHVSGDVVLGVDGSPLAEAAIGPAASLADSLKVQLWVVTAVTAGVTEKVTELRNRGEHVSESAYVKRLADDLNDQGATAGWEVVHNDDPAAGIVEFARQQGAGFIVAGTHGESGFRRLALGSVCMGIVAEAPMPVLAVKSKRAKQFLLEAGPAT